MVFVGNQDASCSASTHDDVHHVIVLKLTAFGR
jgi:hypothetical protein